MTAPDPRLQLQPPPRRTRFWLAALTIGLPLALIGGLLALRPQQATPAQLAFATVVLVIVFLIVRRAMDRHRLAIDDGILDIATTFYRRRLPLGELRLEQARVIDLGERIEFRPALRSNGLRLPGLHSGWFRLRDRRRAFVAIADGQRVLWLPTTRDYDLLLQPRQPGALLEHLRQLAAPTAAG